MLKIGEFSKLTKVSVRMLHYYDSIGLLKPMEINHLTGYRYYSVSQVPTLQKIIMLRDLKFQISEITHALENWKEETLLQQLDFKIKEREAIIHEEQQQICSLKQAIAYLHTSQLEVCYNIVIREVPAQNVISLRRCINQYWEEGTLWAELFQYLKEHHIELIKQSDNSIAIYHEKIADAKPDVEVCVRIKHLQRCAAPFQCKRLAGVEMMACRMVRGSYHKLEDAYRSFSHWLMEQPQYEQAGLYRQVCHRDHTNEENEEDYLTEIQLPVRCKYD